MKRVFGILLSCCLLASCAKPNYEAQDESAVTKNGTKAGVSCGMAFKNSDTCGNIQWLTKPVGTEFGSFLLTLSRIEHGQSVLVDPPLDDDQLLKTHIFLWMPSMGHGSVPVQVMRVDRGLFRVDHVSFIMRGDWEIHVQFLSGTEVRDEAVHALVL